AFCGYSSVAERLLPKQDTRVRFPLPAPVVVVQSSVVGEEYHVDRAIVARPPIGSHGALGWGTTPTRPRDPTSSRHAPGPPPTPSTTRQMWMYVHETADPVTAAPLSSPIVEALWCPLIVMWWATNSPSAMKW